MTGKTGNATDYLLKFFTFFFRLKVNGWSVKCLFCKQGRMYIVVYFGHLFDSRLQMVASVEASQTALPEVLKIKLPYLNENKFHKLNFSIIKNQIKFYNLKEFYY